MKDLDRRKTTPHKAQPHRETYNGLVRPSLYACAGSNLNREMMCHIRTVFHILVTIANKEPHTETAASYEPRQRRGEVEKRIHITRKGRAQTERQKYGTEASIKSPTADVKYLTTCTTPT